MQDYLIACLGEYVAMDIDNYPRLYAEMAPPSEAAQDFEIDLGDAFVLAFEAEFGLSLADAARTSAALQQIALDEKVDVVQMPQSSGKSIAGWSV